MKDLISEFEDVLTLYSRLGEELTRILEIGDSKDARLLVKAVIENRDCLDRVTQMNSRVMRLSDAWAKCRAELDPETRDKVCKLAEASKAQAAHLQSLCTIRAQRLQTVREKLGRDLAELGKATRYLTSMKPRKGNYPKFVDTLY